MSRRKRPRAALIGLVEDGDRIEIDISARAIRLAVAEEELRRRRAAMEARGAQALAAGRTATGKVSAALRAYAAFTTSAARGAVRDVEQRGRPAVDR